jgi:hypothetical protein
MSEKEKFIKYFLKSAYNNMAMEEEAIYEEKELYKRYKLTLDSLINQ